MKILVINAGSSSHKLSLYDIHHHHPIEPLWKGMIDWGKEQGQCFLSVQTKDGKKSKQITSKTDLNQMLLPLLETMWQGDTQVIENASAIEMIGHRVVHGGWQFQCPTLINRDVKEEIRKLIPLAPLHNPANLEGIILMENMFPSIPQIAVFDTAFHYSIPQVTQTYPIPYHWKEEGIQRYGFHGISHYYCSERIGKMLNQDISQLKVINCHLGNGSSLCAIRYGVSIDTTMGLTPLEGLMMGSRCGSIDPGILLYLLREKKLSVEELDQMLNFESGLKGIGGSSDMREILSQKEASAILAVEMYVYRLKSYIGALAASLGGLDVLSFTAGIGENAAVIRQQACQGMEFLGIELDEKKNESCQPDQDIAMPKSKVRVLVIHTQEEWIIARQCFNYSL